MPGHLSSETAVTSSAANNIFQPIEAEQLEDGPVEIESLCVNCEENGTTRLLLTKIPFYREVILMSFHCDHCGLENNEIQSGGRVQEHGIRLTLKVKSVQDMNRQVVKSEYAAVEVPEVELSIPSCSQAGEITTVEGILGRAFDALSYAQKEQLKSDPDQAEKVWEFLSRLEELRSLKKEFTLIIDDPSGNSYVENPVPYQADPSLTTVHYARALDQQKQLGLMDDNVVEEQEGAEGGSADPCSSEDNLKDEVLQFKGDCSNCGSSDCETNMKIVDIPNFKNVVLMTTICETCGHKDVEVQSNSGIQSQGIRIELIVSCADDLKRSVLKSDTCDIEIPEIELECGGGAFPSRYTTIEGLLTAVKDKLYESGQFLLGDSGPSGDGEKLQNVIDKVDDVIKLQLSTRVILDDPTGNTYVETLFASGADDVRLKVEYYDRTWEQNEELGLNDMVTEDY